MSAPITSMTKEYAVLSAGGGGITVAGADMAPGSFSGVAWSDITFTDCDFLGNRTLKVRMSYTQEGDHVEPRDMIGMEPGMEAPTRFGMPIAKEKDLFNAGDRWLFVGRVAAAFHRLMQKETAYMESQISVIAGWKGA